MAANDEDYALQLHKQLNGIPLRTRRGQDLIAQPSFDRNKQDPKRDKGGRPRTKRTNSSSQDHPSSKKKRPSDPDDDHGHTSAHTNRVVKREPSGVAEVKVFYAGVRWGLSLQPAAVKSRQVLAKSLNDAFVGEILSVGQGECLSVVFLDVNGSVAQLGPTKWRNSKADTAQWTALAKTAARLYVRGPDVTGLEASLYSVL
eukprot:gene13029-13158_t